ncbi:MAG: hypothetical protein M3Z41_09680 [Candidatus Eremiobacteraeota bacterium]|nr:hypothetical protein [Candidatus Eremiobacteraeota bacterium]
MPSAKHCSYFKDLFSVTKESFDKHHLTAAQRSFIMRSVRQIPAAERRYAKWILDSDVADGLLIFDAFPVRPDDAIGSHAAWLAVNTNVGLDPIECRMFATPIASSGAGSTPEWPNIEDVSSLRLPL